MTIVTPRNKTVTTSAQIPVRGLVSDPVGVSSLTVNGRGSALTGSDTFSSPVRLHLGKNAIVVAARNVAGNAGSASVTVTYKLPPCKVPKLHGRTLAAARRGLARSGCAVGTLTGIHSRKVRRGRVVSSKPAAGATRRRGTKVSLVLSRGR